MRALVLACSLAACGRIGFDARVDALATGGISRRGTFVARAKLTTGMSVVSDTFTASATQAGDAIVVDAICGTTGSGLSTNAALTAPGWTFVQLASTQYNHTAFDVGVGLQATFGAIAPDDQPVQVTVTFNLPCTYALNEIGDEFSGVDPAGGTTSFDATVQASGVGDCVSSIATGHTDDALWAVCFSGSTLLATGANDTLGADDHTGDWSEYRLTNDPAGTLEPVQFTNTSDRTFALAAATLKPARSP